MTAVFLAALTAGLLLAVRAMLYGVERVRRPFGSPAVTPAPVRMWEPVAAAFGVASGIAGYLTTRPERMSTEAGTLIAVGVGMVAALAAAHLVRKAVAFVPEHDPDDPRYVLQGHVALVTAHIDGANAGEIVYETEGARHTARAVGLDGSTAEAGTEVVIESIDENGTALVEPWTEVEKRI